MDFFLCKGGDYNENRVHRDLKIIKNRILRIHDIINLNMKYTLLFNHFN